ncbi:inosine/xanthosine triphosphatase [Shewanella intestini]|uniref:Inosine/xanthosine triphosphatase n=1 Tax=Shewanella intestini TaxID=2017544 RepID=A0ABS5I1S8_9GAMM|nr:MULTISPECIES: inosine/xanthosine triphosphatase [Shewanella]MBR9727984.1 non-canonical purine NTP phosphatase [Shewanella intestini]MRG36465.1 non-canonical purine NTP phosphatase [Shewanella sp. XMDDZSB0408]
MPENTISLIVGSTNPVKINAAKQTLSLYYPDAIIDCQSIAAPSQVADQPMTDKETQQGAINRVNYCQQQYPNADFCIAMEGGVDLFDHGAATFAYMAIIHQQRLSVGRGALLPLPKQVYHALTEGEELGHVMDRLFKTDNIKQKGGAIGLLTQNLATRTSNYTQALVLAMAPFVNPELYD